MNEFIYKPNFKKRIIATILDYGFFLLLFYVYVMYFGEPNAEGGYTASGFYALPIPIMWFIYFVIIEANLGGTVGHHGLGLKVVKLKNRRDIGISEAFKRHLLDPIDILIYGIPAFLTVKFSEKHQRIGDMVANTIVVDTSDPEQHENKDE
mgnify:CR=1 FL=1